MPPTNYWSKEDDIRLWSRRSKPIAVLAEEFDRSKGGIRSRLKHLQNPEHKAYQRLFGGSGVAGGGVVAGGASVAGGGGGGASVAVSSSKGSFIEAVAAAAALRSYGHISTSSVASRSESSNSNSNLAMSMFPSSMSTSTSTSTLKSMPMPMPLHHLSAASPRHFGYDVASVPTRNNNTSTTSKSDSNNNTCSSTSNVTLNPEQERVLQLALSGKNIFLTGAAGVGKSFLLRHIVKSLQDKYSNENSISSYSNSRYSYSSGRNETPNQKVAVTASTGIAASHIDGTTLHSWAGIGITSPKEVTKLIQKVSNNTSAARRWRSTKTLVIDEISMIDGQLFDALDAIGKQIRGNANQPFGGLQLVLSGDFYQLPPVSLRWGAGFPFSSRAWRNGNIIVSELMTVVRQSGDLNFVRILRELREGKCSTEAQALLATCHVCRKKRSTDGILPTKLYCTNKNVDAENKTQLNALGGTYKSYRSRDRFKGTYTNQVENSIQQVMEKKAPSLMQLKVGAQVMLLKNTPEWNLVNGSRGVVIGFDVREKKKDLPIVRFTNGAVHTIEPFEVFQATPSGAMIREQLPLKLACEFFCFFVID